MTQLSLPYASLPEWFEHQVALTPEAIAVVFEGKSLTYAQLNARANQLARALEKRGVGREKIVALCLDRSLDLLAALFGVLKAGGAYLPVDPALPKERQTMMLEDAGAALVLTQASLLESLPAMSTPIFDIDAERAALAAESSENLPIRIAREQLAYLMYTSGSTGKPKGVEIEEKALVNFLVSMKETPGLVAGDVLVAVTTLSFDIAALELYLPLVTGAKVVLLSRADASDGFRLLAHLTEQKATVLQATPATWRMLLETQWTGSPGLKMLCGGEALPRDLANQLLVKGKELWNMYGPTETTIWSAVARIKNDNAPIAIGEPVAQTQLYILDPNLQQVPQGVTGELLIGGLGLARGYHHRAELTAEKFIPDPFSTEPGARLYKTGDVARLRGPGQIEILGRIDHQVKIRGFRIELGEIEARLTQHPHVKEAVVVAREDTPGRKQLAAYVVTKSAAPDDSAKDDKLAHWRGQWEMLFQSALASGHDRTTVLRDFDSVVTTLTNGEHTKEEAAEWLACSLERVRALKARRVLEIGCGSGQLLLRLAPESEEYWGVDYSKAAVDALNEYVVSSGAARPAVRVIVLEAAQLSQLPLAHFDTIVINSVAQYFPDAVYFLRVLGEAAKVLAPNGRIYLGDVQSYSLLECHHTAGRLHRAPDAQAVTGLRQLIAQRMAHESELMVDPAFFNAARAEIPAIKRVEMQLRRGKIRNQFSQFHYDVVLHTGEGAPLLAPDSWVEGCVSLVQITTRADQQPNAALGFRAVPNARLTQDVFAVEAVQAAGDQATVADLRTALKGAPAGVEPEDLWELGARLKREVRILPNLKGNLAAMDVVLGPVDGCANAIATWDGVADKPAAAYTNQPFFESAKKPLVTELREFLEQSLPDYMVPSFFEVLPTLPKTPNGKINRKALPRPSGQAAAQNKPYVAPRNDTESKLAEVWQQVLGREKVGIHDNIFEIGGDSLLIFQITARANQTGLPVALRQVFQHRTIAELAAVLGGGESEAAAPAPAPITAVSRGAFRRPPHHGGIMTRMPQVLPEATTAPPVDGEEFVMPCSISQERFWVLHQLSPGQSALNIPLALKLKGPLKAGLLHQALEYLVDRHESLRTTFARVNNDVRQVVLPSARLRWSEIDLRGIPLEKREKRMQEEMRAEAVKPMILTEAPILRPTLMTFSDEEHGLLLTLHHIICDGWANGVLVRELGQTYHALVEGREPALPPLSIQFADYALWERDWVKTLDFEKHLEFWEKELAGAWPSIDFPTDHPRRGARMFPALIESKLLPARLVESARQFCQETGSTLFMLFLAVYTVVLYRYTGQRRFIVGTTAANRARAELENLIGQFANPVMLPAAIEEGETFRALLDRVREMSLSVMNHQGVPFESILEHLQSKSSRRAAPVIQAHFLFQRAFMQPAQYGPLNIAPVRSESPGTTFDFTFGIVERNEGIRLQAEHNTALFELPTIRRLLGHFETMLEGVLRNPDLTLNELEMLTIEEQVSLWNPAAKIAAPSGDALADPQPLLHDFAQRCADHFQAGSEQWGPVVGIPAGLRPVVLDANLRLLPRGVPGDLYFSASALKQAAGVALAAGPLDTPAPVALFRTGFTARLRADGNFELRGEAKDMVAIGGFRINLKRVRAALMRHPSVADAAAATTTDATGQGRLLCYVIPRAGATLVERELRDFLKETIGELTLPERIQTVTSFPRDAHGRVVAELLPDPQEPRERAGVEKMPPEALLYHQLLEVWKDILKIRTLTIEDNFFALGGSSLLALRMMTQVEKLCGRPLPLSLLLTGATIANLARHIIEANNESVQPLIPVQTKGSKQPIFFLHGDWAGGGFYTNRLSELLGPDQPFYVLPPYRSGKDNLLTMEEMAAYHIAAMQKHTPHGPYIIGGYCIGATVAREMARQLVAKGEGIMRLLLIDPPLWNAPWFRWVWPNLDKIGDLFKWDLQRKIYYFDQYCVSFSRWLKLPMRDKYTKLARRLGLKVPEAPSPLVPVGETIESGEQEILQSMDYAVYFLAYRLYLPEPWRVPATLFFPESTIPTRLANVYERCNRAPVKFEIALVAGDHHTCITKHTPDLVEKIKAALKKD